MTGLVPDKNTRVLLEERLKTYYHQWTTEAKEYWLGRGLNTNTARDFLVGFVDDPLKGDERFRNRLAIPYIGANGHPVSFKFRSIDGSVDRYTKDKGDPSRLFNTRILTTARKLTVTEGECLTGDAEVLTPSGWVALDKYEQEPVVQWRDGQLEMVQPSAYIAKFHDGELLTFANRQRFFARVTPGHRMPWMDKQGRTIFTPASGHHPRHGYVPRVGVLDGSGVDIPDDQLRLLVALSADATIDTRVNGQKYARFGLKKQRKIVRLRELLSSLNIQASDNAFNHRKDYQSICFTVPFECFREFPNEWLVQLSYRQRELILQEILLWDGNSVPNRKQIEYASKLMHNAVWVQTLAHTSGYCSTIIPRSNKWGEWFKVSILFNKKTTSWQSLQPKWNQYDGMVYCVTVPSGAFLVRQGDCISVTGNCDTMAASQAGLQAIGIPGATQWKPEWARVLRYREITVLADGDDAGHEFAEMVAERVFSRVRIIDMPNGEDVCSMLKNKGEEWIRGVVLG